MDFEQRAGNVGHAQLVLFQDLAGAIHLIGVQVRYILVPHAAKLDPFEAKVVGRNRAGVIEVRGNLIINDGETEGTAGGGAHRARQGRQRTRARQAGKKVPAR